MDNNKPKILNYNQMIRVITKEIANNYWYPLYKYLEKNPELIKTVAGFLLNHEKIIFYIGKTHLAIEYIGPELNEKLKEDGVFNIQFFDYSISNQNFFDNIIGFKYDGSSNKFRYPLPQISEDWLLPTNAGLDKLVELKWNFNAQNSIIGINTNGFEVPKKEFCRIVNGLFFDADEKGLKTRHIKWIDFIPLILDNSNPNFDRFKINIGYLKNLIKHDAHYIYPLPPKNDFKFSKLPQINRFVELISNNESSETQITKFLEKSENKFILTMGFLAKEIHPQIECEWQSERKENIRPDFFVVRPNGFADIVEFKLPHTKIKTVVGRQNRATFSSEINSYISQTRNYKTYFEDPNNRIWVEKKFSIKVHYPKRILIVGRRWDFSIDDWKSIVNDYKDVEIMTYDDLIDGVVAQFYM